MATLRKTITLGAGTHVLRFRVVSPSGTLRLRPVNVQYGAEIAAAESVQAAFELKARVYAGASIEEPLAASEATAGAQTLSASLVERIRMYDRYRPSGITVADLLRGMPFRPWWYLTQGGGALWRRPPGRP